MYKQALTMERNGMRKKEETKQDIRKQEKRANERKKR